MHRKGKTCDIIRPAKTPNGNYICARCGRDITMEVLATRNNGQRNRRHWFVTPTSKEEINQLIINHVRNENQY